MLRRSGNRRAGGSLLDQLVPGWQQRVWAQVPSEWKVRKIQMDSRNFEKSIDQHKKFQHYFMKYKSMEAGFAPVNTFRKMSVDWRRQLARGTLWIGRWHEGPKDPKSVEPFSDYRPGNSFDRLKQEIPFTKEEWAERRNFRHWDGLTVGFTIFGLFMANRITQNYPVVWC